MNVSCQDQQPLAEDDLIAPRVHEIFLLPPIPVQRVIGRDKLYLTCMASGNPAPNLEWSRDGVLFREGVPFNSLGGAGGKVKHILRGNALTITEVTGDEDSGRYRCIATNSVGSVFLEKIINIRVIGEFFPPGRYQDPPIKLNPTIGRNYIIKCPQHVSGYGTKMKWGTVSENSFIPSYFLAGRPHKRGFPMSGNRFAFSYVTRDDLIFSKNVGGVRCIMVNFGFIVASVQMVLWQAYKVINEVRKPILIQHMPETMEALVDTSFSMSCGATGYPLPKYRWQYQGIGLRSRWLNGSLELNFEFFRIKQATHVLEISRVTKYSGGTFRCYAYNTLGQTKKTGQLTVLFPPKMIRNFEDSYDVRIGSKWSFNCSATGAPTPKYEWYHNGTLVDAENDVYRTLEGGVLTLLQARYIDNGIYICIAINKVTSVTISTQLKIKAMAPVFNVPIMDPVFVYEESSMEVACDILGGPLPTITWLKGNAPVTTISDRYKVMPSGALHITKANEDDIGKYTCRGENVLGAVEQTTTIQLLKPTVITNPPEKLTYQVGWHYGMMYCGASHDERLDLRIEWYKAGVLMNKFDSRIYLEARASGPPRILYFHDFKITDAGNYSCHAYTKYGDKISEQWAHGSIRIKGPPEPVAGLRVDGDCSAAFNNVGKPPSLRWIKGEELGVETRRFYIEYATIESAEEGKWYGGEGPPKLPGRQIYAFPGTANFFRLSSSTLVPGANLIFRIRSAADHSIGRPSRPSKKDECITPPLAPVYNSANVTVLYDGPGTLTIWWEPVDPIHYGATGFHYIVGYKKLLDPDYTTEKVLITENTLKIESPGVDEAYSFYVRSANDKGIGPDPEIYQAKSGTEKPSKAPSDVHVKVILTYSVEFGWAPTEDVTGYRITYWNVTDSEDNRGFTPDYFLKKRRRRDLQAQLDGYVMQYQYFFGNEYRNGANLVNATADQVHQATVAAINSGGIGPESEMIEFMTAMRIPEEPIKVSLQIFGESAKMTWNPPLHPGGFVEGYVISWYRSDPHDKLPTGKIEQIGLQRYAREAYLIKTFEPMKYYNIRLQARNRMGQGLQWEKQLVAVSANDIPGKPDIPLVQAFDDTSVNVTFRNSNYGGLPTKFRVIVRIRGRYYEKQVNYEQDFPQRAWILVKDLDYLIYDIHTVGVNPLGQSETSDVVEFRPKKKPKFNAHSSPTEWWGKYWFIIISQLGLFLIIFFATLFALLRSNNYVSTHKKEKSWKTLYSSRRDLSPLIEHPESDQHDGHFDSGVAPVTLATKKVDSYVTSNGDTTSVTTFGGHTNGYNTGISSVQLHNPPAYQSRNQSLQSRLTDNSRFTENTRNRSQQSIVKKRPASSSSSETRSSISSRSDDSISDSESYTSESTVKSGKSVYSLSDDETKYHLF